MFYSAILDQHKISYELRKRKTKKVTLKMLPNLKLIITAPPYVKMSEIDKLIKENEVWILEKRKQLILLYPELLIQRQFNNGELYRFLGKEFTISVIESKKTKVEIVGSILQISITENTYSNKEKAINKWLRDQALFILEELFQELFITFETKHPTMPKLNIRNCNSIWGSCHYKKNTITLNRKLIHLPLELIKYVIYHELVHLHHHNHSSEYYRELNHYVVDYKMYKSMLKKYSIYYF